MAVPWRMQLSVFLHIARNRVMGRDKYPLVLMLEPLFACNLDCAGCGKVRYPPEVMRRRLSPEECWEAAEECGAPIVSVAGGEPLVHPEAARIVDGLVRRGRSVILCTNALLLEANLHRFRPSSRLVLSVHLDGPEAAHDRVARRPGAWRAATAAIRAARARGFHVTTNTTVFLGEAPAEFRKFFDDAMAMGVEGMTISPGYAYGNAGAGGMFLGREQARAWFREALKDWRSKGWSFTHSPFYLDFLEGRRDYDCTPWGNPLRNVFGWQRPCYLMSEGGYAASYRELLETTPWSSYGPRSGNPMCANCLTHVGYEPSIVVDCFSSPARFVELVKDYAGAR